MQRTIKERIIPSVILVLSLLMIQATPVLQHFDRKAFYAVMASGDVDQIDAQLQTVKSATLKEKEAFDGVLTMKKAGLVRNAKEKLALFRAGRKKLEAEIAKDTTQAELRFLRLIIQEQAPGILHYRKDLQNDSKYIHHQFKKLLPVVQQAVIDYSKKSRVLNPAFF